VDRTSGSFLWGVAGAGHQIEGDNTGSDYWVAETVPGSMFAEPSGTACDHYARFEADIALLAGLGYSCYRFSVEWSRVEPTEGAFDQAALDHYGHVVDCCRRHDIEPIVTYHHFTAPAWFAGHGGWGDPASVDRFDRYCAVVADMLGDRVDWACTFNEPNVGVQLREDGIFPADDGWPVFDWQREAAAVVGSNEFSIFPMGPTQPSQDHLLAAHRRAVATIRSANPSCKVGLTLAVQDYQSADDEGADAAGASRARAVDVYLDATDGDDFVGVQTYTRASYDSAGPVDPGPDVERTQMGYEFYPEALGGTIRYVAARSGTPVFVTENGVATNDDARRLEYLDRAVASMRAAMADGIEVVGYCHWSIFDNYEWVHGYRPTFGVIAVDRTTQQRTPKPSAYRLSDYARGTA
jgi:beta-glucosidase